MKHAQPMRLSLRSLALLVLLSQASCSSVSSLHQHQVRDVRAKQMSMGSEENNEYVDMSSMGERISSLQMNMLNKKAGDNAEQTPNDEQMILLNSNVHSNQKERSANKLRQRQRLRSRSRKEDLDDSDIMAYSAGDNSQSGEDGPSIFGSGGAISEALAANDPDYKEEEKPKPKKLSPGELLKIKQDKEKAEQLAKKKKQEELEKKKKEEAKKKAEEEKKKVEKAKEEKEETAQLERQTHLLQNFLEDDKETQKENESDYFYIKNPKKSLTSLADTNIKDQTEVETANDIIQKSRKTILTGMDGGLNL